jgi:hypothetical protein
MYCGRTCEVVINYDSEGEENSIVVIGIFASIDE